MSRRRYSNCSFSCQELYTSPSFLRCADVQGCSVLPFTNGVELGSSWGAGWRQYLSSFLLEENQETKRISNLKLGDGSSTYEDNYYVPLLLLFSKLNILGSCKTSILDHRKTRTSPEQSALCCGSSQRESTPRTCLMTAGRRHLRPLFRITHLCPRGAGWRSVWHGGHAWNTSIQRPPASALSFYYFLSFLGQITSPVAPQCPR